MAERAPHMTCREVVELVTDYLEAALPAAEASVFEQHLLLCEGCLRYVEQIRTTVDTAGQLRPDAVPTELMERLTDVFRSWSRP